MSFNTFATQKKKKEKIIREKKKLIKLTIPFLGKKTHF